MKIILIYPGILLFICLLTSFPEVSSQAISQKATRQSAQNAFSSNNFELAYEQYTALLVSYPKDLLYKYYCGVCLVKLNRDPLKAVSLLQEAMKGSTAIRSVPADGLFFLGRAQQMSGKYSDAIRSYNSFTEQAGKRASREAGVPDFLKECYENKGAVTVVNNQKPEISKRNNIISPSAMVTVPEVKKTVSKQVDSIRVVRDTLPWNYDVLLSQALDYQFRADSITALADEINKRIETANIAEKADLKDKAQTLEKLAASNQKIADQKLAEARTIAAKTEATNPDTQKVNRLPVLNIAKSDSVKKTSVVPVAEIKKDTAKVIKEEKTKKVTESRIEKQIQTVPEIFSIFEIEEKPSYSADEKIPVNPDVHPGLIYRIQVAVLRNPASPAYFKGISPIVGFRNEGAEVTNYYAGMFRRSADASKALTKVRARGFKDAFIVALFDKKVVSADRAAVLEKEWGTKSLAITGQKVVVVPRDTIPPTLVFRIEAMKSSKPVPPDQMENIRKLAGNRGVEKIINDSKQNIILIGIFLTFESASEYADLLVRNGLKEAKVVAYLGKKEIPVETAKQLFENK
jgi:tetratricopeptide (TPR) repeat protein